jgi:adenine-specific DNA-methyltransferase
LSLDESIPPQEADETVARSGETSRQALWRDELLKTGVRGKGGAMLRFAEFETLPGLKHIHASGSLAETGKRVVVSFGPEHAALEQRQVELALTEAETLRPSPKFILFCAFTFDLEAAKNIDEVNWPGPQCSRTSSSSGSGRVQACSCTPSNRMDSRCESSADQVMQQRPRSPSSPCGP